MLFENRLRRPSFRPGTAIRLADGQTWTIPGPPSPQSMDFETEEYGILLDAIDEAEDSSEQRRAELALVIHLLGRNYELDATSYARLLSFRPGNEASLGKEAMRRTAAEHLQSRWTTTPRKSVAAESSSLTRMLSRFRRQPACRRVI